MPEATPPDRGRVRTAEIIAALSLATDLALGVPLEYGLRSTQVAMRLCRRLEVEPEIESQTYFLCLLFYVGCTAPVDVPPDVFADDDSFLAYALPQRFGGRLAAARGMMRAVAPPTAAWHLRARQLASGAPRLAAAFPGVLAATCEVARMLTDSLGLGPDVSRLFAFEEERWNGKGMPDGVRGDEIPLPVRIVHVARDATFQHLIGDEVFVASVMEQRAGRAFDPAIAELVVDDAPGILGSDVEASLWESTLAAEPRPWLMLSGAAIDDALAAMGHFSDMTVSHMVGHSSGLSELVSTAVSAFRLDPVEAEQVRRSALIHDLGRVAVPIRIWEKPDRLNPDEWEQVRLHAYHTERILVRSPFLAELADIAGMHHERLDGSGYHRGAVAPSLRPTARLLAAADAYHAMIEARPHRAALSPSHAAQVLVGEADAGRLAQDAVVAVLDAAGHRPPPLQRPGGLTDREVEVLGLLVRGLQTKQIARSLGISPKTADFHLQNAYRKMEVSTRAGAILFAMQHGLATWENSR